MDQLQVECAEDDILGQIVIIKKDSTDGGTMPLLRGSFSWLIGAEEQCDLRIKNALVKSLHMKITVEEQDDENFGETYVFQYQAFAPLQLNCSAVPYVAQNTSSTPNKNQVKPKTIKHGDVFRVGGRAFRIEYPQGHMLRKRRRSSTMMPNRKQSYINFQPVPPRIQRVEVMKTPTRVTKPFGTPASSRRRVTFGNRLSPEIFDYRKPPDTPIRKGSTPMKKSNERKSILKDTPMRAPLNAVREESMQRENPPKLDLGPPLKLDLGDDSEKEKDEFKDMPGLIPAEEENPNASLVSEPGNFSFDEFKFSDEEDEPNQPKKTPSIEQVPNPQNNQTTPTTPAEKRKARRKSSLFQPKSESSTPGSLTNELLAPNEDDPPSTSAADITLGGISDFDISDDVGHPPFESTKVNEGSKLLDSTAALMASDDETNIEDSSVEPKTPEGYNFTEHPTEGSMTPLDQTPKVTSVGSMRKKVTSLARVSTVRSSASRRRTCGGPSPYSKMRVKRFSADPAFIAKAIKLYGMKLMKNRLENEPKEVVDKAMEILDKENKSPNEGFPTPKLEKSIVKIPSTPSEALDSLPKPIMENQNEILVNRVEMDETISPIHKALFKKDMTPVKPTELPQTPDQKETEKNEEELAAKKQSEGTIPQNPVTPGPTAMKGLFTEESTSKTGVTPGPTAMKGLFAEENAATTGVTPGPTAMKGLFAEENKAKGNQTPHQSAMKGLFQEEKEQQAAATPIQGELHQMFKEQKSLPTPNVRKIFSEMAHEMKTPDGKAMKNIFGDGQEKTAKEHSIPQNPVTPGGDAMTGLFGSKTPIASPSAKIFESPARENMEDNTFATPGRGKKFSDFADSAFKHDESRPKTNEVTPGQTAMKAIFEPAIEPQSPLLDARAMQKVFQSPVLDLDNEEHVKSMEDMTDDVKIGNTSIRQLISEAGLDATPEQIAYEYIMEGDPIEIKFDEEMSTSTASLRRLSETNTHRSRTRKTLVGSNAVDEPNVSISLFTTPDSEDDEEDILKDTDKDVLQLDASMALDKSQEKADSPAEPEKDLLPAPTSQEKKASPGDLPRRRGRPSIKPKAGQELESPKKVGKSSAQETSSDAHDEKTDSTTTDAAPDIVITEATPKRRGRPSLKPKVQDEPVVEEKAKSAATPKRRGRSSVMPKAEVKEPTETVVSAPKSKTAPEEDSPKGIQSAAKVETQPTTTPKRKGRPSLAQKKKEAEGTTEVKTPKRRGRPSLKPKVEEEEHTDFFAEAMGEPSTSATPKRRSIVPPDEAFLSPVSSQASENESVEKANTEEDEEVQEPSPVKSKRGRKSNAQKAKEAEEAVEDSVEKSTRKSLLTMAEDAAQDSVVADKKTKARKSILDKAEDAAEVPEPNVPEATADEIPILDELPVLEHPTAEEQPATEEKPKKRGRKPAPPVATSSRRTRRNSASESSADETPVAATPSKARAKKAVAATPVRRSRRVSTLETPKVEAKKEEEKSTKRRPRARKIDEPEEISPAKQAKIEEPESVEAVPAEIAVAPRRTRRTSKTETAEAPKEEPAKKTVKRRKRDISGAAETSDNEVASKPTRGRKSKKEETVEKEDEDTTKAPKRAGRKPKKAVEETPEEEPKEVGKSPVKKVGRKARKVEEPVIESPKKKAGRSKKAKESESSDEPVVESPKKKGGRQKKVKDPEPAETVVAEEKPKRGRKAKEPAKDLNTSDSQEETDVPAEKPKRGRKPKAVAEPVEEGEKPKRGRSKKASSDESSQERTAASKGRSTRSKAPVVVPEIEMEHVDTVSCLKKSKRGIKPTVSFQENESDEQPEEEPAAEVKSAKKPTKKAAAAKKASSKKTEDVEEKPKARGRKKAAEKEAEESEAPSTRSTRSTRSRK